MKPMAKPLLEIAKERTMKALATHTDPQTVTAIGVVLSYPIIVALLKIHRQIPDDLVHRWIFRDPLKENEYRDLEIKIYAAWQGCIDAKLIPMMILTHAAYMKRVTEHLEQRKQSEG